MLNKTCVLCAIFLFLISGCGLSRDKAAKEIEKKIIRNNSFSSITTRTIPATNHTGDTFQVVLSINYDFSKLSWGANPNLIFLNKLVSANYIKLHKDEKVSPAGFGERHSLEYSINSKGANFIKPGNIGPTVTLGKVGSVIVTGISDISENLKKVKYTVNIELNELGKKIGITIQPITSSALFRKYDDGWRIE